MSSLLWEGRSVTEEHGEESEIPGLAMPHPFVSKHTCATPSVNMHRLGILFRRFLCHVKFLLNPFYAILLLISLLLWGLGYKPCDGKKRMLLFLLYNS